MKGSSGFCRLLWLFEINFDKNTLIFCKKDKVKFSFAPLFESI